MLEDIEHLISQNVGNWQADLAAPAKGGLAAAASLLTTARRVAIITGFPTARGPAIDGIPGALMLAEALSTMGKRVKLIADIGATNAVHQASMFYGQAWPVVSVAEGDESALLVELEDAGTEVLIAIGCAGHEALFEPPMLRVAIGCLGNELGMGMLPPAALEAARIVGTDPIIPNPAKAHATIVAGFSDWGAYGIIAGLGFTAFPRLGQHLNHMTDRRLIEHCLRAGAVDRITGKPEIGGDVLKARSELMYNLRRMATGIGL